VKMGRPLPRARYIEVMDTNQAYQTNCSRHAKQKHAPCGWGVLLRKEGNQRQFGMEGGTPYQMPKLL